MKKYILVGILIMLGLGGCGKQQTAKGPSKHRAGEVDNQSHRVSKYDEDIGAFVLEDDADFDIFGDDAGVAGENQPSQSGDPFSWHSLDDADCEDGQTVYFDYDSDELQPSERSKVRKNAKEAKQSISAGATVLIEGHSCLISHSEVYNTALSQRRAERIAKEYQKLGVPRKVMKVVGRGASKAVCFDDNKDAQSVNRRVETKLCYGESDQPAR